MLRRFRKRLPHISRDQGFELLLEFFAIVIGVIIALGVDEWREEREIEESNQIAVERLNEEIRQNRDELAESVAIVSDRFDKLAALNVDNRQPFRDYFRDFGGFNIPNLKDSVWRRLVNDRWANRISGSYLDEASLLYHRIQQLRDLEFEINRHGLDETYHDPERAKIAHRMARQLMLQQIVWMREALALHDDFVQRNMDTGAAE